MVYVGYLFAVLACGAPFSHVASLVLPKHKDLQKDPVNLPHDVSGKKLEAPKGPPVISAFESSSQSQFEDSRDSTQVHECLGGKTIVFIGPSTAKSDYLTLTYFAEYGRWPDKADISYWGAGHLAAQGPNPLHGPSLEYEKTVGGQPPPIAAGACRVGTAAPYLQYSNTVLNGHEVCDCYKNDPTGQFQIADIYNQTENRIYRKGTTTIAYFQWFGDIVQPRGSVNLSPVIFGGAIDQQCPAGQFKGAWDWSMPVPTFISHFVKSLKPTHLIIDAAYWPTAPQTAPFWEDLSLAGAAAVAPSLGTVFWRTVPLRNDYPIAEPSSAVNTMRFLSKGWKTWDARAVVHHYRAGRTDTAIFADTVHLSPHTESFLMWTFLHTNICYNVR